MLVPHTEQDALDAVASAVGMDLGVAEVETSRPLVDTFVPEAARLLRRAGGSIRTLPSSTTDLPMRASFVIDVYLRRLQGKTLANRDSALLRTLLERLSVIHAEMADAAHPRWDEVDHARMGLVGSVVNRWADELERIEGHRNSLPPAERGALMLQRGQSPLAQARLGLPPGSQALIARATALLSGPCGPADRDRLTEIEQLLSDIERTRAHVEFAPELRGLRLRLRDLSC
jgi:hypothetical protein